MARRKDGRSRTMHATSSPAPREPAFAAMAQKLQTERLLLRSWRSTDAAAVRELWTERDPRSLRLIDAEGHPTVAEMGDRLADQLADSGRTGLRLLAIERRAEPGLIGYCGLIAGQSTEAEPEIAFELFRSAHGRGYATEAARAVVDEARRAGHARLWATVREWNAASLAVLAKLDFVDSGRRTEDAARGATVWMTRALHSA